MFMLHQSFTFTLEFGYYALLLIQFTHVHLNKLEKFLVNK